MQTCSNPNPKTERMRAWTWRLLHLVLLTYLGLMIYAFAICDQIIFPVPPPSYRMDDPNIITVTADDGSVLPALWLPNPKAKQIILYCHANAEDLGSLRPAAKDWHSMGYAVLAVEYPGYGQAKGDPSEEGCYAAAFACYAYLKDAIGVAPEQIIVYGRSLGGGIAVELAQKKAVGGVILESTFLSAFRVLTHVRVFPFDRFNNYAKIDALRCPLLILHGEADTLAPAWHGRELYTAADKARFKQLTVIPQAGHNNVSQIGGQRYQQAIAEFLQAALSPSP